jgi:hypothetical protein
VLRMPPQSEEDSVEDMLSPATAQANNSNGSSSNVQALRPTGAGAQ